MSTEIGRQGEFVDPGFLHHEHGAGLLPLPSNLIYWNGEDAPLDHSRLSPEENVTEFLLYLSGIKNKPVGRPFAWGEFYADLFRHPSTAGDVPAQMHLLAAVVHGWFVPQLYRNPPDFALIAAKTAQAHLQPEAIVRELAEAGFRGTMDEGGVEALHARLRRLNAMMAVVAPELVSGSPPPNRAKPAGSPAVTPFPVAPEAVTTAARAMRVGLSGFAG
jgi:hypothetical protein